MATIQESNTNKLNALTTFINNSDTIDNEHKAAALAAQATHNANQEQSISDNNDKILELYSNLGSMSVSERESALAQIDSLTRQ
ncbi:hypothetical protein, partial [Acinetobacter sp. LH3_13]|uniref:hypothetical protein n=1 Tax=Acinetobacter sp. LH3_13 TaxID=3434463 RepID=UPI003EBB2496